jgi:transcriptional regulator with XRE-family HTH domain
MDIGEKLQKARIEKGLSLRALGKLAHVSYSFIADIESGRSKPSIDTLKSLTKSLGISSSELIDDNNDIFKLKQNIIGPIIIGPKGKKIDLNEYNPEDQEYIMGLLKRLKPKKKR